jgi:hypothetical protein
LQASVIVDVTRIMARNPPKPARKSGPRKSFVGSTQTKPPPDIPSNGAKVGLLSKRKIWIAASAAAVTVVAVGIGFQFLNGGAPARKASSSLLKNPKNWVFFLSRVPLCWDDLFEGLKRFGGLDAGLARLQPVWGCGSGYRRSD